MSSRSEVLLPDMQSRRYATRGGRHASEGLPASSQVPVQPEAEDDYATGASSSSSSSSSSSVALNFRVFTPVAPENPLEMAVSDQEVVQSTPLPPSNQLGAIVEGQTTVATPQPQSVSLFHPEEEVFDPKEIRSSQAYDLIR